MAVADRVNPEHRKLLRVEERNRETPIEKSLAGLRPLLPSVPNTQICATAWKEQAFTPYALKQTAPIFTNAGKTVKHPS